MAMLYETMIVDIDTEMSVLSTTRTLTRDWVSVDNLYAELKEKGKTDSSGFWNITATMLNTIVNHLAMMPDDFREEWNRRCYANNLRMMGYHCTRQKEPDVFLRRGVLPLSDEVLKAFFSEIIALFRLSLLHDQTITELANRVAGDNVWKYRLSTGAGPYFFVSYKEAKKPDDDFHRNGPEIWWLCTDYFLQYCQENNIDIACSERSAFRDIVSRRLLPYIVHCEIPYSMIPFKDDCIFYLLRAFFTSIDPEDDIEDFFDGKSIDLKGQPLEPKYITRIEQLGNVLI